MRHSFQLSAISYQLKAKKLIMVIATLLIATMAMAKDDAPQVSAGVDKRSVLIGDRIIYTIEARPAKGALVAPPDFKDGLIGEFEIRDRKKGIRKGFFGGRSLVYTYDISVFTAGEKTIPASELKYKERGSSDWKGVMTKPVTIKVDSLLPKGKPVTDIRDIKGPLGYREINWILISMIAAAVLAAALALWAYVRHRTATPVKLPHETALEELESMKGELARTGDIKRYYVGVSDAVRNYIERQFQLKAPEMTTEEFLNSTSGAKELSAEHKRLLREFLASCDLVKFAKYSPKQEEVDSVLTTAGNFIEETKALPGRDKKG